MPAADVDLENEPKLPFPPIRQSHILHCSTHYWYPKYRTLTPKSRLVPLSPAFVSYLHADGIVLPPEGEPNPRDDEFEADLSALASQNGSSNHTTNDADGDESDEAEEETNEDPSSQWPEVHSAITSTIAELGGKVVPKLNWSAPKDSTWINPTNSMECRTANEIYLMLKSSDFVTHDLEHAFDGCVDEFEETPLGISDDEADEQPSQSSVNYETVPSSILLPAKAEIPYTLMLRKSFALNPSVEFRCFVRHRHLLAISQRSVNYFDFLAPLVPELRALITDFFNDHVKTTFPDDDFVFDVYVPDPYQRVWLIDFNPWAPRTDPLLFSWLELLTMQGPEEAASGGPEAGAAGVSEDGGGNDDEEAEEEVFQPEFRLIKIDDPEAYSFNTPQYSAHKLPSDVVQASQSGPGPLREFAEQWKEVLNRGAQ